MNSKFIIYFMIYMIKKKIIYLYKYKYNLLIEFN